MRSRMPSRHMPFDFGEEVIDVARAEYPLHVGPVMWHRVLALAPQALLLHLVPVVVGAPHGAAGEARLEGDGTRREIAAQRDAGHADALGVDVGRALEPVVRRVWPSARWHAVAGRPERRSASPVPGWSTHSVATPRRASACGSQRPVQQLLAAIEAVDVEHARRRRAAPGAARQQCGQRLAFVRNLHALGVLAAERDGVTESLLRARDTWLRGRDGHGPACARPRSSRARRACPCARRTRAGPRASSSAASASSLSAILTHCARNSRGAGVIAARGGSRERPAHVLDLADLAAAFERHVDGEIPDVVVREVLEQGHAQTSAG